MALIYSIFFLIPSFFSIIYLDSTNKKKINNVIYLFILSLLIFIGLRANVGVDFASYLWAFEGAIDTNFLNYFYQHFLNDFGYYFINWIIANLIGPEQFFKTNHYYTGIFTLNVICLSIYLLGIYLFTKGLENQLLAITIFVPYLLFVVSIAYVRQSVAFGFVLISFFYFINNKTNLAILFSIIAILFHKSVLVFLPFFVFFIDKRGFLLLLCIFLPIILTILLHLNSFIYFASQSIFPTISFYQANNVTSSGFNIRLLFNILPSLIFLVFEKNFKFRLPREKYFWRSISISIFIFALLSFFISSTILDRCLIYFSILQPFVFSQVPQIFSQNLKEKFILILLIIFIYFSLFFVWLNFAKHSYSHLDYNILILEEPDLNRPFFKDKMNLI